MLFTTLLSICSCKEIDKDQETKQLEKNRTKTTLALLLNEKKEKFEAKASEEKKRIYAEGITSIVDSGVIAHALNVGDKAPNFTLYDQNKKPVILYEELKEGPVILTWYRGGWCPYCNITLHYFQEKLSDFKNEGASLIALTPELPDSSLSTKEKNELAFTVVSDINNQVAKEFKIVFKLTPGVADSYQKSFDLHAYNGNENDELPLAATYIIDKSGIIQYCFLDADYRNRAEPNELISVLQSLNSEL